MSNNDPFSNINFNKTQFSQGRYTEIIIAQGKKTVRFCDNNRSVEQAYGFLVNHAYKACEDRMLTGPKPMKALSDISNYNPSAYLPLSAPSEYSFDNRLTIQNYITPSAGETEKEYWARVGSLLNDYWVNYYAGYTILPGPAGAAVKNTIHTIANALDKQFDTKLDVTYFDDPTKQYPVLDQDPSSPYHFSSVPDSTGVLKTSGDKYNSYNAYELSNFTLNGFPATAFSINLFLEQTSHHIIYGAWDIIITQVKDTSFKLSIGVTTSSKATSKRFDTTFIWPEDNSYALLTITYELLFKEYFAAPDAYRIQSDLNFYINNNFVANHANLADPNIDFKDLIVSTPPVSCTVVNGTFAFAVVFGGIISQTNLYKLYSHLIRYQRNLPYDKAIEYPTIGNIFLKKLGWNITTDLKPSILDFMISHWIKYLENISGPTSQIDAYYKAQGYDQFFRWGFNTDGTIFINYVGGISLTSIDVDSTALSGTVNYKQRQVVDLNNGVTFANVYYDLTSFSKIVGKPIEENTTAEPGVHYLPSGGFGDKYFIAGFGLTRDIGLYLGTIGNSVSSLEPLPTSFTLKTPPVIASLRIDLNDAPSEPLSYEVPGDAPYDPSTIVQLTIPPRKQYVILKTTATLNAYGSEATVFELSGPTSYNIGGELYGHCFINQYIGNYKVVPNPAYQKGMPLDEKYVVQIDGYKLIGSSEINAIPTDTNITIAQLALAHASDQLPSQRASLLGTEQVVYAPFDAPSIVDYPLEITFNVPHLKLHNDPNNNQYANRTTIESMAAYSNIQITMAFAGYDDGYIYKRRRSNLPSTVFTTADAGIKLKRVSDTEWYLYPFTDPDDAQTVKTEIAGYVYKDLSESIQFIPDTGTSGNEPRTYGYDGGVYIRDDYRIYLGQYGTQLLDVANSTTAVPFDITQTGSIGFNAVHKVADPLNNAKYLPNLKARIEDLYSTGIQSWTPWLNPQTDMYVNVQDIWYDETGHLNYTTRKVYNYVLLHEDVQPGSIDPHWSLSSSSSFTSQNMQCYVPYGLPNTILSPGTDTPTYQPPTTPTGPAPTHYWKFNGNLVDSIGSLDMSTTFGTYYETGIVYGGGQVRQAINGAISAYIADDTSFINNTTWTLTAWIKIGRPNISFSEEVNIMLLSGNAGGDSISNNPTIKLMYNINNGSAACQVDGGLYLKFFKGDPDNFSILYFPSAATCASSLITTNPSIGKYLFFYLKYDGSNFYVNIDNAGEKKISAPKYPDNSSPNYSAFKHFQSYGGIDDLRVYDKVLSSSELADISNAVEYGAYINENPLLYPWVGNDVSTDYRSIIFYSGLSNNSIGAPVAEYYYVPVDVLNQSSKWIVPDPNIVAFPNKNSGNFTYKTTFSLSVIKDTVSTDTVSLDRHPDLNTVFIRMDVSADDKIVKILLNGSDITASQPFNQDINTNFPYSADNHPLILISNNNPLENLGFPCLEGDCAGRWTNQIKWFKCRYLPTPYDIYYDNNLSAPKWNVLVNNIYYVDFLEGQNTLEFVVENVNYGQKTNATGFKARVIFTEFYYQPPVYTENVPANIGWTQDTTTRPSLSPPVFQSPTDVTFYIDGWKNQSNTTVYNNSFALFADGYPKPTFHTSVALDGVLRNLSLSIDGILSFGDNTQSLSRHTNASRDNELQVVYKAWNTPIQIPVTASNGVASTTTILNLRFDDISSRKSLPIFPSIKVDSNVYVVKNNYFSLVIKISGYPTPNVVLKGVLPQGVLFDSNTYTLYGTPTSDVQTFPLIVEASNGVKNPNPYTNANAAITPFNLNVVDTIPITPPPPPPSSKPIITLQPLNQTVIESTTVTFHTIASGNPTPTIQWQQYSPPNANGGGTVPTTTPGWTVVSGTTRPLHYYRFNNDTTDYTGNLDLIQSASCAFADGLLGKCIVANDNNFAAYAAIDKWSEDTDLDYNNGIFHNSSQYTIAFWAYTGENANHFTELNFGSPIVHAVLAHIPTYKLSIRYDGNSSKFTLNLHYDGWGSDKTSVSATVAKNSWHFLTVICDGQNTTLAVDNINASTINDAIPVSDYYTLNAGSYIDDLRIYDVLLSNSELTNLNNNGKPLEFIKHDTYAAVADYYQFDSVSNNSFASSNINNLSHPTFTSSSTLAVAPGKLNNAASISSGYASFIAGTYNTDTLQREGWFTRKSWVVTFWAKGRTDEGNFFELLNTGPSGSLTNPLDFIRIRYNNTTKSFYASWSHSDGQHVFGHDTKIGLNPAGGFYDVDSNNWYFIALRFYYLNGIYYLEMSVDNSTPTYCVVTSDRFIVDVGRQIYSHTSTMPFTNFDSIKIGTLIDDLRIYSADIGIAGIADIYNNNNPQALPIITTTSTNYWIDIPNATQPDLSFTVNASDNNKAYRVYYKNNLGTTYSNIASLSVLALPKITKQPDSQTAKSTYTVTFAIEVSSVSGYMVQWQSSSDGVNFTNIPSTNSLSYTHIATPSEDGYSYRAVVSNTNGSVTSNPAILSVNYAPTITVQPSPVTIMETLNVTFSVTANGNPGLSYQWQYSDNLELTWNDIQNATNATYTFEADPILTGNLYRVIVSNAVGSIVSDRALLTLTPYVLTPTITLNPINATVADGGSVTFTAAAVGDPTPTVIWSYSSNGGGTWVTIGVATNTSYTFNAAFSQNGYLFKATFTNTHASTDTSYATLTVNQVPLILTSPIDTSVHFNTTASFTATASGSPTPALQWQKSVDGGVSYSNISGATSDPYTFTAGTADNSAKYRAVFTNVAGSATSNEAALTVTYQPIITLEPVNVECVFGDTAKFISSCQGLPIPTALWQISNDGGITWSGGVSPTVITPIDSVATQVELSFKTVTSDNGTLYRVVFSNTYGSVISDAATLTVDLPAVPPPTSIIPIVNKGIISAKSNTCQTIEAYTVSNAGNNVKILTPRTYFYNLGISRIGDSPVVFDLKYQGYDKLGIYDLSVITPKGFPISGAVFAGASGAGSAAFAKHTVQYRELLVPSVNWTFISFRQTLNDPGTELYTDTCSVVVRQTTFAINNRLTSLDFNLNTGYHEYQRTVTNLQSIPGKPSYILIPPNINPILQDGTDVNSNVLLEFKSTSEIYERYINDIIITSGPGYCPKKFCLFSLLGTDDTTLASGFTLLSNFAIAGSADYNFLTKYMLNPNATAVLVVREGADFLAGQEYTVVIGAYCVGGTTNVKVLIETLDAQANVVDSFVDNLGITYPGSFKATSVFDNLSGSPDMFTTTTVKLGKNAKLLRVSIQNGTMPLYLGFLNVCTDNEVVMPDTCSGNINGLRCNISINGIPREEYNIFGAIARWDILLNNKTRTNTSATAIPKSDGRIGTAIPTDCTSSTLCNFWKQQGENNSAVAAVLSTDIQSNGLAVDINKINDGDLLSLRTNTNWIWPAPLGGGSSNDQYVLDFGLSPNLLAEQYFTQKIDILLAMNKVPVSVEDCTVTGTTKYPFVDHINIYPDPLGDVAYLNEYEPASDPNLIASYDPATKKVYGGNPRFDMPYVFGPSNPASFNVPMETYWLVESTKTGTVTRAVYRKGFDTKPASDCGQENCDIASRSVLRSVIFDLGAFVIEHDALTDVFRIQPYRWVFNNTTPSIGLYFMGNNPQDPNNAPDGTEFYTMGDLIYSTFNDTFNSPPIGKTSNAKYINQFAILPDGGVTSMFNPASKDMQNWMLTIPNTNKLFSPYAPSGSFIDNISCVKTILDNSTDQSKSSGLITFKSIMDWPSGDIPTSGSSMSTCKDPADQMDITIEYTGQDGKIRSFTKSIDLSTIPSLADVNSDDWFAVSSYGNGKKGDFATWIGTSFVLDNSRGTGLDQCLPVLDSRILADATSTFTPFSNTVKQLGGTGSDGTGSGGSTGTYKAPCFPVVTIIETLVGKAANEKQSIVVPPSNGGYYTLTFNNQTAELPYNADQVAIRNNLASLISIGSTDNVTVTGKGSTLDPFVVEFTGALSNTEQSLLIGNTANLQCTASAVVSQLSVGSNSERQVITNTGNVRSPLVLSFSGQSTEPIPYNASINQFQTALSKISKLGTNAKVSGNIDNLDAPYTGPWNVDFINSLAGQDMPNILVLTVGYQQAVMWKGSVGVNTVQQISLERSSGSFQIKLYDSVNGVQYSATTDPIAYDATADDVAKAIIKSANFFTANDISVSCYYDANDSNYIEYRIEFTGNFAKQAVLPVSVITTNLNLAANLTITRTQTGTGIGEKQRLSLASVSGGFYYLTVTIGGTSETTAAIPFDSSDVTIENALVNLNIVKSGDIVVRADAIRIGEYKAYLLTFNKSFGDVPMITAKTDSLICDPTAFNFIGFAPPYNYAVPHPLPSDNVAPPVSNVITPEKLGDNVVNFIDYKRELIDPATSLYGEVVTIKQLAAIKRIDINAYNAYTRDFKTNALTALSVDSQISNGMSIVFIEKAVDTTSGRSTISSHLSTSKEIMPSRMTWQ